MMMAGNISFCRELGVSLHLGKHTAKQQKNDRAKSQVCLLSLFGVTKEDSRAIITSRAVVIYLKPVHKPFLGVMCFTPKMNGSPKWERWK